MFPEIYPCILAQETTDFEYRLKMIESSSAHWLQVDIMDGQFVDNYTVQPKDLIKFADHRRWEIHLMVQNPAQYYHDLQQLPVGRVLLHREIALNLEDFAFLVDEAKSIFPEVGIVLNPDTDPEDYSNLNIQSVQCMGVVPGASGQILLDTVYDKIKMVKYLNPHIVVAIDGGVNEETIPKLKQAGVNRFIMASAMFATQKLNQNYIYFTSLIQTGGV